MSLAKASYYGDWFVCPIAVVYLLWITLLHISLAGFGEWLVALAIGVIVWTFIEYLIHRWVYHAIPYIRDYHEAHHDKPNDYIGAPAGTSLILIFLCIYWPLLQVGFIWASGVTVGVLLGYYAYMAVHHGSHHWPAKAGSYFYELRLRHIRHHHKDTGNYGVTTLIWDHVFGTAIVPTKRQQVRTSS
jgi:sterol desaturase/sphingolipid hydroxylase (fatty acid hydroxylase superfamily)